MKIIQEDKSSYNGVFLQYYFLSLFCSIFVMPFCCILTKYSNATKNKLKWLGGLLGFFTSLSIIPIGRGCVHIASGQWFGYLLLSLGTLIAIFNIVMAIKISNKNKLRREFRLSKSHIKDDLSAYFIKFGVNLEFSELDKIIENLDLTTHWNCASNLSGCGLNDFVVNKDLSAILNHIPAATPSLEEYKQKLLLNIFNLSNIVKDKEEIIPKFVVSSIDKITQEEMESILKNDKLQTFLYNNKYAAVYRYNYECAALGIIIGILEANKNTLRQAKKLLSRLYAYAEINGYKKSKS